MPNETLEDKLNTNKPQARGSFFDFMASAYTSSKSLKIAQLSLLSGYSLLGAATMSGIFYLGAKTAWNAAKYSIKFLGSPLAYLKGEKSKETFSDIKESYKPFGKYVRPHLMPWTLYGVTELTKF